MFLELIQGQGRRGKVCPHCDSFVKIYRRKLHSEMARFLIRLCGKWERYSKCYSTRDLYPGQNKAASDGSYLVHWGLVERTDRTNTADAPSGMYAPTSKGLEFYRNQLYVPTHVHLLHNKIVGWSDKQTNIRMALGQKFNYEELMNV